MTVVRRTVFASAILGNAWNYGVGADCPKSSSNSSGVFVKI